MQRTCYVHGPGRVGDPARVTLVTTALGAVQAVPLFMLPPCYPPPPPPSLASSRGFFRVAHASALSPPPVPRLRLFGNRRGSTDPQPFQGLHIVAIALPDTINKAGTATDIEEHRKAYGTLVRCLQRAW
jgi:hypothetical protein